VQRQWESNQAAEKQVSEIQVCEEDMSRQVGHEKKDSRAGLACASIDEVADEEDEVICQVRELLAAASPAERTACRMV